MGLENRKLGRYVIFIEDTSISLNRDSLYLGCTNQVLTCSLDCRDRLETLEDMVLLISAKTLLIFLNIGWGFRQLMFP